MRFLLPLLLIAPLTAQAADKPVPAYKTELPSTRDKARILVGNWLGDQPTEDGGRKQWLMKRRGDGAYTVYFKHSNLDKRCEVTCETGIWGVSGDIYFTRTMAWCDDGTMQAVHAGPGNAYTILELIHDRFRYRFVESDQTYTVNRTSEDATLSCP